MNIIFFQRIRSPHNTALIAMLRRKGVIVEEYYCDVDPKYGEKKELENKTFNVPNNMDISFIRQTLKNHQLNSIFLIVGWQNINTILLQIYLNIFRIKYVHYTDFPNPTISRLKKVRRSISHLLLQFGRAKILCLGKQAYDHFVQQKFNQKNLTYTSLPIDTRNVRRCNIARNKKFRLVLGSRLSPEKGFDLFLKSLANTSYLKETEVFICGDGPSHGELMQIISDLGLSENVSLVGWVDLETFMSLIKSADLFVQPSRFDAYGSAAYAVALGVFTIGSKQSGAAFELIEEGVNGLIYDATDTHKLTAHIDRALEQNALNVSFVKEPAINEAVNFLSNGANFEN